MVEGIDWNDVQQWPEGVRRVREDTAAREAGERAARQAQLDRIETKLDEMLAFRDLILETVGPFLTGGKSKVWLALLAKTKGRT